MFMIIFSMINLKILSMSHPLMITIMMIIQTSIITMIIGLMSQTFWMSYIMFLTFIGGLLVLFIYISSLTSNKILNFNKMNLINMFILILIISWTANFFTNFNNLETMKMFNFSLMMNFENNLFMSNFYNQNELFFTIMMMIYLFLMLIISVKITNLQHSPMRIKS
uniref:NADH-ubiquinone oxidoreductase chain 6 n=1 Tax=Brachycentrus subnubilus TaxID=446424 RepID=A0A7D6WF51_9NEOP|nr:NADH dehydrogenase subunit 6 [Brachycentrus subnubilus]